MTVKIKSKKRWHGRQCFRGQVTSKSVSQAWWWTITIWRDLRLILPASLIPARHSPTSISSYITSSNSISTGFVVSILRTIVRAGSTSTRTVISASHTTSKNSLTDPKTTSDRSRSCVSSSRLRILTSPTTTTGMPASTCTVINSHRTAWHWTCQEAERSWWEVPSSDSTTLSSTLMRRKSASRGHVAATMLTK